MQEFALESAINHAIRSTTIDDTMYNQDNKRWARNSVDLVTSVHELITSPYAFLFNIFHITLL